MFPYLASVMYTTRNLVGKKHKLPSEVCSDRPALTHVQSSLLSALSYEMCSYNSICFKCSALSETKNKIYNTDLKCHIRSMGSFMQKMSDFIVRHQTALQHKFHQLCNFYQPYLKCMVIQIIKFLIEWHIASFKRKIVFQIMNLFFSGILTIDMISFLL